VLPAAVDDVATQANVVVSYPECESTQSMASDDPCGSGSTLYQKPWCGWDRCNPAASNVVAANSILWVSTGGNQKNLSIPPPTTLAILLTWQ